MATIIFTPGRLTFVYLFMAFSNFSANAYFDESDLGQSSDASDEDNATAVFRRSVNDQNMEASPLDGEYMIVEEPQHVRERRAVKNTTYFLWGHQIPYSVHSSYSSGLPILKRVLAFVDEQVCISHVDVTEELAATDDPEWLTKNGFESNSFLNVSAGPDGCLATLGRSGSTKGGQKYNPCIGWVINLHETLHTLGVVHTQRNPNRDNYIRMNMDNVVDYYKQFFKKEKSATTYSDFFNTKSPMLYGQNYQSVTGLEVWFPIRDDLFQVEDDSSYPRDSFAELNQVYECNSKSCNNNKTDCDLGYFAKIKGECQCACPEGLDTEKNCMEHIDLDDVNTPWPQTAVTLIGPDCPEGFESGQIIIPYPRWGPRQIFQMGEPFKTADKKWYLDVCTRTSPPEGSDIDWSAWGSEGGFCIVKPIGVDCDGGFSDGSVTLMTPSQASTTGAVGDVTINAENITIRFCCQERGVGSPLLPHKEHFNLISKTGCPDVDGMRYSRNKIIAWQDGKGTGLAPANMWKGQTHFDFCYYIPAKSGCNKVYRLSSSEKSVQVTTPTGDEGRDINRKCLYDFRAPEGSIIKVTFDSYDMEKDDLFYIKRDHQYQNWYQVKEPLTEFLTTSNYLSMKYWSSWKTGGFGGLTFTVEALLAEESCYEVEMHGRNYKGDKSLTESYEPCLPWSEAVTCIDFPWDDVFTYDLLSPGNNKCRNPRGELLQPWCYTFVRGNTCWRRYCEVCNYLEQKDVLTSCEQLVREDPDFCIQGVGRQGCAKTCQLPKQSPSYSAPSSCSQPVGPAGSSQSSPVQNSYIIGDRVDFACGDVTHSTVCTGDAWTKMVSACDANVCEDNVAGCPDFVSAFPDFCDMVPQAVSFCQKSCGACDTQGECSVPTSPTYTSDVTSLKVGEAAEFQCAEGHFYVSGDLRRACGADAAMLGSEPVCSASPVPLDVNLKYVRGRPDALKFRKAFLLDEEGYSVPFAGKITKWYHFCKNSGDIEFIVYRKDDSGNFKHVASNEAKCEGGFIGRHLVPAAEQISVQAGDAVGVYSASFNTIAVNQCHAKTRLVNPLTATGKDATALSFKRRECLYPSLGYRIEP